MEEENVVQAATQEIANESVSDIDEKVVFSWRSEERLHKVRGKEFYSTIVVLAFLISVILFFIEGVMPVLVVWAIVFVVWATNKTIPVEAEHSLTNWGIRTGGKLYRFSEMALFWLEEKWGKPVLRIILTRFPGQVILVVHKEDEAKFKKTLTDRGVTMQKPEPSWVDNLVKWFSEKIPLE